MRQGNVRAGVMALGMVFLIVSVFLIDTPRAHAEVRNVPSQYPSIQAAINSARNGDTVRIADGVYRENIEIVGKYITLSGNSDRQSVVLAGNGGKTPIMIQNVPYVAGGSTVITGLKITGGNAPDGQGGGITVANNADPVIYNNTIENNRSVHGGGILVYNNSNPIIRNNNIRQNTVNFFGGGIYVVRSSSPNIANNTITGNIATGGSITNGGASGGGIYLENITSTPGARSKPVVANNTITGNTADFAGGGVMLRVGVDAIIEKNVINDNSAAYGGGVHVETEGSAPYISSNTISNNRAPAREQFAGSGYGGGISVYAGSQATIRDNKVTLNQSTNGGAGIVLAENSSSQIYRNIFQGNAVTGPGFVQGGGLYISGAVGVATNNMFADNSAYLGGGIAAIGSNAKLTLNHNTIAYNSAGHTQGGGGIFVNNNPGTIVVATNNIMTSNTTYQAFEQLGSGDTNPKAHFENNIITNTGSGLYFNYATNGITSAATFDSAIAVDASNTIGSDPLFVDAASRDFRLNQTSPAINNSQDSITEDLRLVLRSDGRSDRGAYEYIAAPVVKSMVYRFWSTTASSHFYTIDTAERDSLIANHLPTEWRYEGTAYGAFSSSIDGTTPLYRFYSRAKGGHFYTIDTGERDSLIANPTSSQWQYEGTAYHVYPQDTVKPSAQAYRFWSPTNQHHFYTASEGERDFVRSNYPENIWTYEGPRFKVPQ
jgi:parallel beta-helix repeat protein